MIIITLINNRPSEMTTILILWI